jgi:GNAT superfamily N-acetyltransferase
MDVQGSLRHLLPDSVVTQFSPADLAELVVLQRCCWVQEAIVNDTLDVPALHESAQEVLAWATSWRTLTVRHRGRLVSAVRARAVGSDWEIGRLMVAPDLAGHGMGSGLLRVIESMAPKSVTRFVLFTGGRSVRNIRTYERAGYRVCTPPQLTNLGHISGAVYMAKAVHLAAAPATRRA